MLHEILLNRQPSNGSIDLKICTDVANKKRQESKKSNGVGVLQNTNAGLVWYWCKFVGIRVRRSNED